MTAPNEPPRTDRYLGRDWAHPALDESNRALLTSGRISLRTCAECEAVQHPPQQVCSECQGTRFSTRTSKGVGAVYSRVVVHHAAHPSLAGAVPYCVALIALDDFPEARIVGNVVDVPAAEVQIGLRVRAVFEQIEDGGEALLIPQWAPLASND